MPEERSIDIDSELDFEFVEFLMSRAAAAPPELRPKSPPHPFPPGANPLISAALRQGPRGGMLSRAPGTDTCG